METIVSFHLKQPVSGSQKEWIQANREVQDELATEYQEYSCIGLFVRFDKT